MAEPVFDAGTLSALTKRIQSGLKSGSDPRKPANTKGRDRKTAKDSGAKREQPQVEKGTKRTRDGKEKVQGRPQAETVSRTPRKESFKKLSKSAKGKESPVSSGRPKHDLQDDTAPIAKIDLRQIINELGGDDDDLKLSSALRLPFGFLLARSTFRWPTLFRPFSVIKSFFLAFWVLMAPVAETTLITFSSVASDFSDKALAGIFALLLLLLSTAANLSC